MPAYIALIALVNLATLIKPSVSGRKSVRYRRHLLDFLLLVLTGDEELKGESHGRTPSCRHKRARLMVHFPARTSFKWAREGEGRGGDITSGNGKVRMPEAIREFCPEINITVDTFDRTSIEM